jgi:crossover junction endodeoxyribonuclease RuvC
MTRILGIDPGVARMGYGIIEVGKGDPVALGYGCVKTDKDTLKEKRLEQIHRELMRIIGEYSPHIMATELLFFSKNAKTAIVIGEARGVILLAAAQCSIPIQEYTPLQVKDSLSGYGRSSKSDVREMVMLHLGMEKFKGNDDAADALAVALCHLFNDGMGAMR